MMGMMTTSMTVGMLLHSLLGLAVVTILVVGTVWLVRQVLPAHHRQPLTNRGTGVPGIESTRVGAMLENPSVADSLRAADTDRAHTAELLQAHHAAGRLTLDEFDQRTGAAHAASTLGELRQLLADLPIQR